MCPSKVVAVMERTKNANREIQIIPIALKIIRKVVKKKVIECRHEYGNNALKSKENRNFCTHAY